MPLFLGNPPTARFVNGAAAPVGPALNVEQQTILYAVVALTQRKIDDTVAVCGAAGTGKTALLCALARTLAQLGERVVVLAYTNKAVSVLRLAGIAEASTIHKAIYYGSVDAKRPVFATPGVAGATVVIVDEASMLDNELANDVRHSLGRGLVVLVGDHHQLPPVGGDTVLDNARTLATLQSIVRTDNRNIIELGTHLAHGGDYDNHLDGSGVEPLGAGDAAFDAVADSIHSTRTAVLLCHTNETRQMLNGRMRHRLGHNGGAPVAPGDPLIAAETDRHGIGRVVKGMLYRVEDVRGRTETTVNAILSDHIGRFSCAIDIATLAQPDRALHSHPTLGRPVGQRFEFAYSITAHKAQGSEWDDVGVFDERSVRGDDRDKWLYTAVTRARRTVRIGPWPA